MFLIFLLGAFVLGMFIWALKEMKKDEQRQKEEKEAKERREEFERRWNAERETYYSAKAEALAALESRFGKCTKEIIVSFGKLFSLKHVVYAFEDSEVIVLDGNTIKFKDIIGFNLLNKSHSIYSAYTTATSKKNLGSSIIRGAAGKMIAGNVGGIIGALTAEDDYDFETSYDIEEDNEYRVYVNVDSISSPTIVLNFGTEQNDAYDLANLLNVIISRNSKRPSDVK